MITLLCLMYAASSIGVSSFAKINSGVLSGASRAKYSLYLAIVGALACFFFWIFGGFSISVNPITLVFALFFALVVASITVLRMVAYGFASVSGVNIIMSGCNIICSLIIGASLFSEEITFIKILRILLMLASIVFTFLEANKDERVKGKSDSKKGKKGVKQFFVMLLIVVTCCAETVILKLFTLDRRVTDDNSFFFWTNALLVMGCTAVVVFDLIREKGNGDNISELFKPRRLACIVGSTLSANIGSIASIGLIALMDVSAYTPVTSALGVIAGVVASLLFREKLGLFSYISAFLALIAVVI